MASKSRHRERVMFFLFKCQEEQVSKKMTRNVSTVPVD